MSEGFDPAVRGALAYFRDRPDSEYWSRHWAEEDLDRLLAVARVSPLTRFIERHVRPGDRVLEAGCGLGQYVRYFGECGLSVVGVDFSRDAINTHLERFPESDLRVADLADLPFPDRSFDAVLSIGVIEHYRDGGAEILREARRVLTDRGVLVLSVPYLNLSRRALRGRIARRQEKSRSCGAQFYQYAFDERQLERLLADGGFIVRERGYYDPGRGLRDLRALLVHAPRSRSVPVAPSPPPPRAHSVFKRRILYARPTLKLLAHMQIVAARKSS